MLDAIVALQYGLDRALLTWILKDCDHPVGALADPTFRRGLDPKGFWRVERSKPPELRHTVLTIVAFDDLLASVQQHGNSKAAIEAFCRQNDGEGWLLPDVLGVDKLQMTHTQVSEHPRSKKPQPVRAAMGPRLLPWQLAQSSPASWTDWQLYLDSLEPSADNFLAQKTE